MTMRGSEQQEQRLERREKVRLPGKGYYGDGPCQRSSEREINERRKGMASVLPFQNISVPVIACLF
jgi:hypothetical protein